MARLSYQAPGVYVEEVPSAQQPIAGVGTNTVGFIGVVEEDTIKYPVPHPDFDPVSAKLSWEVTKVIKEGKSITEKQKEQINALKAELEDQKKEIEIKRGKLPSKKKQLEKVESELIEMTEKEATELEELEKKLAEELDPKKKNKQINDFKAEKKAEIEKKNTEIKNLKSEIDQDENDIDKFDKNKEALEKTFSGQKVDPEKKVGTILCPYDFETFTIKVRPGETKLCTNFGEYKELFGPFSADNPEKPGEAMYPGHRALTHAVNGFFNNGGTRCFVARVKSRSEIKSVLEAFESIDAVAIMATPGLAGKEVWTEVVTHCETCEDRFAIFDNPEDFGSENDFDIKKLSYDTTDNDLPQRSKNAAFYFPYIEVVDPAKQLQDEDPEREIPLKYRGRVYVPPSGHIAGIYARTDEQRGVHKAPANEAVRGALNVKYYIGKRKQELLNPHGVNVIRNINGNVTVWGARTIGGDRNGEWKYVSVRRLFLFLAESIDEGTQWVVFEPNDHALWGKIKRNVSAFLTNVWRSGALFGMTPAEAFYVKCDEETNPPEVRDLGQVITEIGVAIVRPAEFVIFRITQSTGKRT
jgi:uncharacterized protein